LTRRLRQDLADNPGTYGYEPDGFVVGEEEEEEEFF
jgi:hypothetical protein